MNELFRHFSRSQTQGTLGLLELIKANGAGLVYKEVPVHGAHGTYMAHRWVRQGDTSTTDDPSGGDKVREATAQAEREGASQETQSVNVDHVADASGATGGFHTPDPYTPANEAGWPPGMTKASRVGLPGDMVPPPPQTIPRLPGLSEKERDAEESFASMFEKNPDGVARQYYNDLMAGKMTEDPGVFSTDDAKNLSDAYNPGDGDLTAKGIYNVATHQTANAIAKRAFLQHLDKLEDLPDGDPKKRVLVTSGGVASGKGFALKKVVGKLKDDVGGTWDAAGEQNATENPWIMDECAKRGITPIFAYIDANPHETWENPDRGVIERAGKEGRMVDSQLHADSYVMGAKNFDAFKKHAESRRDLSVKPIFHVISNHGGVDDISEVDSVPEGNMKLDPKALNERSSKVLDERKDKYPPHVFHGGAVNRRVWNNG